MAPIVRDSELCDSRSGWDGPGQGGQRGTGGAGAHPVHRAARPQLQPGHRPSRSAPRLACLGRGGGGGGGGGAGGGAMVLGCVIWCEHERPVKSTGCN